jgi:hypothetical protein
VGGYLVPTYVFYLRRYLFPNRLRNDCRDGSGNQYPSRITLIRPAIVRRYLDKRPHNKQWSSLIFPKETPSRRDFRLWKEAIPQIRALGGRLHIGLHLRQGHKIWLWKYDIETLQLFHIKGDTADLYEPALGEGARSRANHYVCTEEGTSVAPRGGPCTIASAGEGILKIISFTNNPPPAVEPSTFQEVLQEWGYTWMWEGLKLFREGEEDPGVWLSNAIRNNSLVAVTDGSYMKELYPNMNSCAFIFECSGGGWKDNWSILRTDNLSLLLPRRTPWSPSNPPDPP